MTKKPTENKSGRQVNRQTDRQSDRQTDRQTGSLHGSNVSLLHIDLPKMDLIDIIYL